MKRYRWLIIILVLIILVTVPMFAVYRYLLKVHEKTLAIAMTRDLASYLIKYGDSIDRVNWLDFERWNAENGRVWRATDTQERFEVYKTASTSRMFPDHPGLDKGYIWRFQMKDTVQLPGNKREEFRKYLEARMNMQITLARDDAHDINGYNNAEMNK